MDNRKYSLKIQQLAEIMGVKPSSIIMEESDFEIIEIYDDSFNVTHYRIQLRGTKDAIIKQKK